MHGLINRSIQCFLCDSYGTAVWDAVVAETELEFSSFEAMLTYPPSLTDRIIAAACEILDRPRESVLEDLGTYLVSHPNREAMRRLLRFGGQTFGDFLNSLEELPERARLAVSELKLPEMNLAEGPANSGILAVKAIFPGVGHVAVGLLRAMADDYGALVTLEYLGNPNGWETVAIRVLDRAWTPGRRFELARGAG